MSIKKLLLAFLYFKFLFREENIDQVDTYLTVPLELPVSQSRQSIKSMLKSEKSDRDKSPFSRVVEEYNFNDYKSPNLSNTKGPNAKFQKGANDSLLLFVVNK